MQKLVKMQNKRLQITCCDLKNAEHKFVNSRQICKGNFHILLCSTLLSTLVKVILFSISGNANEEELQNTFVSLSVLPISLTIPL